MHFTFTKAGREWNEDRCYATEEFAFVIDGATALNPQKFSEMNTDAEWYENWWYEYLKEALKNTTKEIPTILREGVEAVIKEFNKLSNGEIVIDFPSCTLSVVRKIKNNMLEIYIIGDSPVLLQTVTGRTIKISDTLNNINDDINYSTLEYYCKRDGVTMMQARKKYADLILQYRLTTKNKTWGYNILSDSMEAIYNAVYKKIDGNIFKKVILLSDGYYQLVEPFNLYSLDELANKLVSYDSAEKLYNELYLAQEADSNAIKFLRMKLRDDATVSVLDLNLTTNI